LPLEVYYLSFLAIPIPSEDDKEKNLFPGVSRNREPPRGGVPASPRGAPLEAVEGYLTPRTTDAKVCAPGECRARRPADKEAFCKAIYQKGPARKGAGNPEPSLRGALLHDFSGFIR
jgi:hypothetical protein